MVIVAEILSFISTIRKSIGSSIKQEEKGKRIFESKKKSNSPFIRLSRIILLLLVDITLENNLNKKINSNRKQNLKK